MLDSISFGFEQDHVTPKSNLHGIRVETQLSDNKVKSGIGNLNAFQEMLKIDTIDVRGIDLNRCHITVYFLNNFPTHNNIQYISKTGNLKVVRDMWL